MLFSFSFPLYQTLIYYDSLTKQTDYLIAYWMVAFIGITSYFCIIQPDIFNGKPIKAAIPFIKYETSGLSNNFAKELRGQLDLLMCREKPFLNPELGLNDLSEKLDISRHHTSQLINEQYGKNFYEFINMYRIVEAKKLLGESENLTIEEIAYKSGFNNRISFYKSFKKYEGMAPTQYRERRVIS